MKNNCPPESEQCKLDIETHLDACFDNEIAKDTLNQKNSAKKCKNNKKLILSFEQCLTTKVGSNYWKNIDLPSVFYSEINTKRIAKGRAPYLCDTK